MSSVTQQPFRTAVLVLVAVVIIVTFLVDLAYAAIDPRLRR